MFPPRLGLLAGLVLALALPLACGGPTFIVQQYDGPIRQRETIAVIRIRGADSVLVVGVDAQPTGVAVDSDARLHIEVLPGEHSIDAGIAGEPARRVWFNAAPGRVYRAVWQAGQARVFEVDDSSDALLTDVSLAGPTPPPAPQLPAMPPVPPVPPVPVAPVDAGAPPDAEPPPIEASAPVEVSPDAAAEGG